jgi:hypothetical protein
MAGSAWKKMTPNCHPDLATVEGTQRGLPGIRERAERNPVRRWSQATVEEARAGEAERAVANAHVIQPSIIWRVPESKPWEESTNAEMAKRFKKSRVEVEVIPDEEEVQAGEEPSKTSGTDMEPSAASEVQWGEKVPGGCEEGGVWRAERRGGDGGEWSDWVTIWFIKWRRTPRAGAGSGSAEAGEAGDGTRGGVCSRTWAGAGGPGDETWRIGGAPYD